MAEFTVTRIKNGYEGRYMDEYISVSRITFAEGDTVIELPATFEGEPITHFGYGQDFEAAHEVWADWHHPGKGSDWEPDHYRLKYLTVEFPPQVKKLVIPATVIDICYKVKDALKKGVIEIEVSPDNPVYAMENGKLVYKN